MRRITSLTAAILAVGCANDPSVLFGNALTTTSAEPPGANCTTGGIRIDRGQDNDGDGVLEPDEITSTDYSCFPGGTLVTTTPEPPGANCEFGGQRVDHGIDDNADGVLDPGEVDSTTFVCNGVDGGQASLVLTTDEPAGGNCANGGIRIDHGVDDNSNGTLESGEIDGTTFACNGANGQQSVVLTSIETAGANCITGGTRIEAGVDDDESGTLDVAEVDSTSFVCNGFQSLIVTESEAPGETCADGGARVTMGVDLDDNGVLDLGEITTTAFVCNGATGPGGLQALVAQVDESPGLNCEFGGTQITSGLDANDNNVLELGEVASTSFVCDGADGSNGAPGVPALKSLVVVSPEPPGSNCEAGGAQIDAGFDADDDDVLDLTEISSTAFVCNAVDPGQLTISGFTLNNCITVDHNIAGGFDIGDDRGGVALSAARMFTISDEGTGSFNALDMTGPVEPVERSDGLVSDVRAKRVYSLSTDGVSRYSFSAANVDARAKCNAGGINETFTHLLEVDDNLATTRVIPLSQPITITDCESGLFAGPSFMIFLTDRFFRIEFDDGAVFDLGARPPGLNEPGGTSVCENWAFWGVAEFDGTSHSVVYRENTTNAMFRTIVGNPTPVLVHDFGAGTISDLCGFTVDPQTDRWYFHLEGGTAATNSAGFNETSGFCDLAP